MEYLPEASFYKNESERNIHVWCSLIRRCLTGKKQFIKKPTLGLVAGTWLSHCLICFCSYSSGCYIHKNWLPVSVFYKWLDMILEVAEYSKDGQS
jgi:transcription elongation factor Elf1